MTEQNIKRAERPTEGELTMIRDSVLLPHMLTMVDKSKRDIELSSSSLRKLYVGVTEILMNRIHADLVETKRQLRERDIKVWQDKTEFADLGFRYICRGYSNGFVIMREVARANISVLMAEKISGIIGDLKPKK